VYKTGSFEPSSRCTRRVYKTEIVSRSSKPIGSRGREESCRRVGQDVREPLKEKEMWMREAVKIFSLVMDAEVEVNE
jgi:hypothetical protein